MANINQGVLDGMRRIGAKVRDLTIDGGLPGAPLGFRMRGATQSGPPQTGTWKAGDETRDRNGNMYICTGGGTGPAATWEPVTYSPATFVVAPQGSGYKADYYTTGTGDQAAINAALAAAAAVKGKVLLKAGTYSVSAPIVPQPFVKLSGEGEATVITSPAITGTAINLIQVIGSSGNNLTDVEICDMKLDGSNISGSSWNPSQGKAIFMQYLTRMKLHGLFVYNSWATGIGTDFLQDSEIDRCVVENCGRGWTSGNVGGNGIGIGTGAYATEDWIVSNCIVTGTGNNGIIFEDQFQATRSRGMMVSNCISYSNGTCGILDSGTSGAAILNCHAFSNGTDGIAAKTGDIGTVQNSFNPQDVRIANCYLYSNFTNGIAVQDAKSAPDGTLYNISINDCEASGNVNYGIYLDNAQKVIIHGNMAYANDAHGIYVLSNSSGAPANNVTIVGNNCANNGQTSSNDGIRVSTSGSGAASDIVIAGNRCWDDQGTQTQRYGIGIGGTASSLLVTVNDVTGNLTAGYNNGSSGAGVYAYGNLGAPGPAPGSAFLCTPSQYAPGSRVVETITGTAWAAFSSASINTGAFTAPPSGSVLITANFVLGQGTGGQTYNIALAAHGTVTLAGYAFVFNDASASIPRMTTLEWIITGLTPGTSYDFDLIGACGTVADTISIYAQGIQPASASSTPGGPVTMTVQGI